MYKIVNNTFYLAMFNIYLLHLIVIIIKYIINNINFNNIYTYIFFPMIFNDN